MRKSHFNTPQLGNSFKRGNTGDKECCGRNWVCAKLRHHISRLKRRTWATSKDWRRLQDHLDLFIAYQNGYRVG